MNWKHLILTSVISFTLGYISNSKEDRTEYYKSEISKLEHTLNETKTALFTLEKKQTTSSIENKQQTDTIEETIVKSKGTTTIKRKIVKAKIEGKQNSSTTDTIETKKETSVVSEKLKQDIQLIEKLTIPIWKPTWYLGVGIIPNFRNIYDYKSHHYNVTVGRYMTQNLSCGFTLGIIPSSKQVNFGLSIQYSF